MIMELAAGLVTFALALPVTAIFGFGSLQLLRLLGKSSIATPQFGAVGGVLIGMLVWYFAIFRGAHTGTLVLGWWPSIVVVGGAGGLAGGFTFGREIHHLRRKYAA